MVEMLAEMVDYPYHAERHAADPETRENMKNLLAESVQRQHATVYNRSHPSRGVWGYARRAGSSRTGRSGNRAGQRSRRDITVIYRSYRNYVGVSPSVLVSDCARGPLRLLMRAEFKQQPIL